MKYLILIGIVLTIVGITFWEWAMVKVASKPAPFTFPNHPCVPTKTAYFDGRRTYANGRPTMPSEGEPEIEFERRTR